MGLFRRRSREQELSANALTGVRKGDVSAEGAQPLSDLFFDDLDAEQRERVERWMQRGPHELFKEAFATLVLADDTANIDDAAWHYQRAQTFATLAIASQAITAGEAGQQGANTVILPPRPSSSGFIE